MMSLFFIGTFSNFVFCIYYFLVPNVCCEISIFDLVESIALFVSFILFLLFSKSSSLYGNLTCIFIVCFWPIYNVISTMFYGDGSWTYMYLFVSTLFYFYLLKYSLFLGRPFPGLASFARYISGSLLLGAISFFFICFFENEVIGVLVGSLMYYFLVFKGKWVPLRKA